MGKNESTLLNLVRIGEVSSVNVQKKTARVIFRDKDDLVSGDLNILKTTGEWLPSKGQYVVCLYLANGEDDGFIIGGL